MVSQKGSVTLILSAIIIMVFIGIGAYYLGLTHRPQQATDIKLNNGPAPSSVSSPQASAAPISSIPENWTYQTGTACDVSIPTPPKSEPYTTNSYPKSPLVSDNNRFWQLSDNGGSNMFFFKNSSIISFSPIESQELGNDYNPGSVSIFCASNPDNLTSDQIVSKLEQEMSSNNYDFKVINKGKENKWGIDTDVINIDGGMFGQNDIYIFASGNKMYFTEYSSYSSNQFVKDTTKQIFDNLKFSN